MKKLAFTTLSFLFTASLLAQSLRDEGEIYYGFKISPINYSKVTNLIKKDADNKSISASYGFGVDVGGFLGIHITDDFALEGSLSYDMRRFSHSTKQKNISSLWANYKKTNELDKISKEATFKSNYLFHYINIVPLSFRYYPIENVSVFAGPSIGILLDVRQTAFLEGKDDRNKMMKGNDLILKDHIKEKMDNEKFDKTYSRFNFSLFGGISWDVTENFGIYGSYTHSLFPEVFKKINTNNKGSKEKKALSNRQLPDPTSPTTVNPVVNAPSTNNNEETFKEVYQEEGKRNFSLIQAGIRYTF